MESSDCLVLGLSVAGVAAALRTAEAGHSVTLVELPEEIPLRARPKVWNTPISPRERSGSDFEALALRLLEFHGARVERDLGSVFFEPSGTPRFGIRRAGESEPAWLTAKRILYASDGTWNVTEIPREALEQSSRAVSASAWSDATFHMGKSAAVAGAGDFAFEQLYWAAQCASELWWIHPGEKAMISEDVLQNLELQVTPSLRTNERVDTIRREGGKLRLGLTGGVTLTVHALFVAAEPVHDHGITMEGTTLAALQRAGARIAGVAAGAPWSQFAIQWRSGWDRAGEMIETIA